MKELTEVYREMMDQFQADTGLDVANAAELSVRLYAVAAQIHSLYIQSEWVRDQCFPQTAQGEYLDRHAMLRGISRHAAARAQGVIRFSIEQAAQVDLTIAAGTVCMTPAQVRFETTQTVTLQAQSLSVDAPAQAVECGTDGNASAGSIRAMAVAPVGISSCTNPEAFSGGSEQEGDDGLRARVLETYYRLSNGANAAYYQKEALKFDEVGAAVVVGQSRGVGTVDVVVSSEQGVPSDELLSKIQNHFEQRREIAVDVQVLAPQTTAVSIAVQIQCKAGADASAVAARVQTSIQSWFDGKRLGKNVLLAQLGALVFSVDGVVNYKITTPSADIAVSSTVLPVLSQVTVEEMS